MRKHTEGILWTVVFGLPLLVTQISARELLLLVAVVWVAAIAVVIPLHFYKAWRSFESVPNRRQYAFWVGLETLFAAGLLGSIGYGMLGR
jgi:hypothetical protein